MSKPGGTVPFNSVEQVSTGITDAAWVQLVASPAESMSHIQVWNTSDIDIELGLGAASAEQTWFYIPAGESTGKISAIISEGVRLSVQSLSGTGTSGNIIVNLWS